ncbi:hypothetical protein [Candidatus Spongiihabitans sp.]|uniref:hypothetical protein n=1 Tax=Candidatus Spongiihabitans sp. TaxID=3101308 RepID=UPI003C6EFB83
MMPLTAHDDSAVGGVEPDWFRQTGQRRLFHPFPPFHQLAHRFPICDKLSGIKDLFSQIEVIKDQLQRLTKDHAVMPTSRLQPKFGVAS